MRLQSLVNSLKSTDCSAMVLLVDDQFMVGEAVRRALENQPNVHFHFCSNAAEALELAEKLKPTVILQDLILPGIDGLTLVKRYRENEATKDIPIIVLSTKEDPRVKSEAFALGANDYLVKLPDAIELVARIRYHSSAYLAHIQRDDAYRALAESQQQLLEANLELQRLSNVDGLTNLSNRRYFEQFLTIEWRRSQREQLPMSIIMIDVDNFKSYNDTFGHVAGDEILRKIAESMQKCLQRPGDLAARFGGEEFIVVLPNTPYTGATHIAEKLRETIVALQLPHERSTVQQYITISIGTATTIPELSESALTLVEQADMALYEAKNTGKNKVVSRKK